jgi:predicted dehydrogenase
MDTALRVGVAGFGKMGMLHAGLVNALDESQLVAVADTNKTLTNSFQQHNSRVTIYDDFDAMLDRESLDAVFITAPTFLHVPMSTACAERKIPFFVEKPLGVSSEECKALIGRLASQPVTNMVGYMARHIDTFSHARRLIRSGVLGEAVHLQATMYVSQLFKKGKGWRYDKQTSGGGVLITQNSHLVDLLQWMFGPIGWVSGHVKSYYSKDVEDFAHAYLGFDSGLTGFIDSSWSVRHHRMVDISIELHAENGTLSVSDDSVRLFLDDAHGDHQAGWTVWRKPDLFDGVAVDLGGPEYTRQDVSFLRAVSTGAPVDADCRNALRVQQVVDAVYASSQSGGCRVQIA